MADILILQSPPPKLDDIQKSIYNSGTLEFISKLHKRFDSEIDELYKSRLRSSNDLKDLSISNLHFKENHSDKSWTVDPLPSRMQNRSLDLGDVSASNVAHFLEALNSDVRGIQVDFDNGHCPTWKNQLIAHNNLNMLVKGQLAGAPLSIMTCPALLIRLRPWNLIEHNILVNGKEAIGPLVDFSIFMYHNAKALQEANSGPYFYLSKLEGAGEAKLWNDIFVWAQNELCLPIGTVKACVIIDNIMSIFEMDDILYSLKKHSLGLNCGVWDYCASILSNFGNRLEYVLLDKLNSAKLLSSPFLINFLRLVVSTCHKRGAPATGGMAMAMLKPGTDGNDISSKNVINQILESKLKEMEIGLDGFLVYDTRILGHLNEFLKKNAPGATLLTNQIAIDITPRDLLSLPKGRITIESVRHNVATSILFIYHWLAGIGHFFYNGNVEDSATAEFSRYQVWHWIRISPPLEGEPNKKVSALVVEKVAADFVAHAHKNLCRSNAERKRLTAARYMSMEIFLARNPPEFIASYLNDNHKFRTLHNKAIISNL